MDITPYEEIAAKAEWEGGWYEVLDWYRENEVPEDIQLLWGRAKRLKDDLKSVLDEITTIVEQHGVEL